MPVDRQPIPPATTAAPAPAVVIDGLRKQFGAHAALREVSATIHAGRLTGLVGPDGAGKTTLLRILTGLLTPSAGRASVAGLDVVADNDAIHHATGYMPQRFGLYEDLTVLENMRLYARLRSLDATRHADLFAELLEFTRLAPFTARLAGKLSGGMKQKLGLACALMARPKVLLLDGRDILLPFLDREISVALAAAVERLGITFYRNEKVLRCDDSNPDTIELVC